MARQKTNKITRSLRIEPDLYDKATIHATTESGYSDFSDYVGQLIKRDLAKTTAKAKRRANDQ